MYCLSVLVWAFHPGSPLRQWLIVPFHRIGVTFPLANFAVISALVSIRAVASFFKIIFFPLSIFQNCMSYTHANVHRLHSSVNGVASLANIDDDEMQETKIGRCKSLIELECEYILHKTRWKILLAVWVQGRKLCFKLECICATRICALTSPVALIV